MSYCRFSTDSFRCDVYAYASSRGFVVHVASRRKDVPEGLVYPAERFEEVASGALGPDERTALERTWRAAWDALPWIELTAPSAGESFIEPGLESFRARMEALRAEGLRFPGEVFARIDDELAAEWSPAP